MAIGKCTPGLALVRRLMVPLGLTLVIFILSFIFNIFDILMSKFFKCLYPLFNHFFNMSVLFFAKNCAIPDNGTTYSSISFNYFICFFIMAFTIVIIFPYKNAYSRTLINSS